MEVAWSCGKELARGLGRPGAGREVYGGGWNDVAGTLDWDPATGQLESLELSLGVASFHADVPALARTLLEQGWFDAEHFPRATFKVRRVAPRASGEESVPAGDVEPVEGWTHVLHGVFSLNGVEKEIRVPAKVECGPDAMRLSACFGIRRSQFKVASRKPVSSLGSSIFKVDDLVKVSVAIDSVPGVARLASQVQAQQAEIRNLRGDLEARSEAARVERNALAGRLADAEKNVEFLRQANILLLAGGKLPAKFEEVLVYPAVEQDYDMVEGGGQVHKQHYSYPGRRTPFTMILVPGDPAKGIVPFYMGETEVAWDLFHDWSHWYDITVFEGEKECEQGLRPSNADSYCDLSHNGMRYDGYPALGMTRLTAERFCDFLSKRTGRKYRLPTEAEWDRAYALGGGDPPTKEGKLEMAWCKENVELTPETYSDAPGKIATKKPNTLGLHDMLGNVAEWVKTPGVADKDGKNTFVRGGDFLTPVAQLSGARREEAKDGRCESDGWNATYPNDPPSRWWYMNHYQVGFRLVCEPVNLPPAK